MPSVMPTPMVKYCVIDWPNVGGRSYCGGGGA